MPLKVAFDKGKPDQSQRRKGTGPRFLQDDRPKVPKIADLLFKAVIKSSPLVNSGPLTRECALRFSPESAAESACFEGFAVSHVLRRRWLGGVVHLPLAALAVSSLIPVWMLLLVPTVMADELVCDVHETLDSHRYLIEIDDDSQRVFVTNPRTNETMPTDVLEFTPQRVALAFNSLALDATEFVRQGRVASLSLMIKRTALVDRSTNRIFEVGFVTDDQQEIVSLEQIHAMREEEEVYREKHKKGPAHHPMFWTILEVATFRYEGTCAPASPGPGS